MISARSLSRRLLRTSTSHSRIAPALVASQKTLSGGYNGQQLSAATTTTSLFNTLSNSHQQQQQQQQQHFSSVSSSSTLGLSRGGLPTIQLPQLAPHNSHHHCHHHHHHQPSSSTTNFFSTTTSSSSSFHSNNNSKNNKNNNSNALSAQQHHAIHAASLSSSSSDDDDDVNPPQPRQTLEQGTWRERAAGMRDDARASYQEFRSDPRESMKQGSKSAGAMMKKYGPVFLGVHLSIYCATLGALFVGVDSGLLDPALMMQTLGSASDGASETKDTVAYVVEWMKDHSWTAGMAPWIEANPHAANFAVSWIAVKFTEPIRLPISLYLTPRVARWIGAKEQEGSSVEDNEAGIVDESSASSQELTLDQKTNSDDAKKQS